MESSRKSKSKNIPSFFKVFAVEDGERLLIPSEVMKDRMPYAFIRDRNEKVWNVEVSQRENKYFFEAGWSKFVQEKNVESGDILVFEYDGESIFDVKIMGGTTACEKEFSVEDSEAHVDKDLKIWLDYKRERSQAK